MTLPRDAILRPALSGGARFGVGAASNGATVAQNTAMQAACLAAIGMWDPNQNLCTTGTSQNGQPAATGTTNVSVPAAACSSAGGTPATDGSGNCTFGASTPAGLTQAQCTAQNGIWSQTSGSCILPVGGNPATCPAGQTLQANGTCAAPPVTTSSTGWVIAAGIALVGLVGFGLVLHDESKGRRPARAA
jgi:hypothetical protein